MTDTEDNPQQTLRAPKDASSKTEKSPTKTFSKSPAPKSAKKNVPKSPSTPEPVQTRSEPPDSPDRMAQSAVSDNEDLTNDYEGEDEETEENGVAEGEEEGREEDDEEGQEEELTERDPNEDSRNLRDAPEKASHASDEKEVDDVRKKATKAGKGVKSKATTTGKAAKKTTESKAENAKDKTKSKAGDVKKTAEKTGEKAGKVAENVEPAGKVDEKGQVVDDDGNVIGKVSQADIDKSKLKGSIVNEEGDVLDKEGRVIGSADPVEDADENADGLRSPADSAKSGLEGEQQDVDAKKPIVPQSKLKGPFEIQESGEILDADKKAIGKLQDDVDLKSLVGKQGANVDDQGNLVGENGTILGKVNLLPLDQLPIPESVREQIMNVAIPEGISQLGSKADLGSQVSEGQKDIEGAVEEGKDTAEGAKDEAESNIPPVSILEGLKVNKAGKIVDREGNPVGQLIEGDAKKLAGKKCDKEGKIYNDTGKVIGRAEPLPEAEENASSPFEDFPGAIVDKSGKVIFEGQIIGQVIDGDVKKMIGKTVDEDGDILDKHGNVIGKAERTEEEPEPEAEGPDYSVLFDKKVNKLGNVTDDSGRVVGRIIQGVLKNMIGRRCDKDGAIWGDNGKKIGQAEPIPEAEKEELKEPAPFEDFPDATVESNGDVVHNGEVIGKVIEGDAKKLKGKKVDADGDILSASGNVLGKAQRWEAPEAEPVPEVDNSSLAGKRVNKAGNVVNKSGEIYGRVVEGDIKQLAGKMCDKNGFVRNEGGDIIGKCEAVPEGDREGLKEGPFTDFDGCTVNKEGKVVTSAGEVVGRLVSGDPNVLFGRAVDDDGEIVDKNGNVLGRAERWQEEEAKKDINPMSGRKVNKEGNVVDENGDVIGKLTSGDIKVCAGKKVDDDGDVVDQKGNSLGHVTLLDDIVEDEPEPELEVEVEEPEPELEPQETEEEKKKREEAELDQKICKQMIYCVEDALDKIKPILKMITSHIDKAERTPKDELDEEDLVNKVKPLIEEGGRILSEANASIRALDPGGRLQSQAKAKTAAHEATPEEYHLADCIKELTGVVTETIENAKRKIEGMPHAKKEINPLWSLLSEPLAQILAAVGLLLSGVLGIVGKLLSGLGLGGLLDNLLGGLGLKNLLNGLGLGMVVDSLTGKKKK
ncbi:4cee9b08-9f60-43d2-84df-5730f086390b [Sclerotinia trifoliorum]|uniref:4cee9b08-9f60-43d2-84df-5730f086390b n=1 Tax=Sclerotinia trifoliorum TaxID=28548 RepID=A0A8H2VLT6_9HELO|nr:4cee9b08-9f60-43d2-84df-5730f086390b [Sclerotinia trifoliorum]